MRLLVDINVIADVALGREGRETSGAVLAQIGDVHEGWIAWHSLSVIAYLLGRHGSPTTARQAIEGVLHWADVAPTTSEHARFAVALPLRDFEDAMQVAAAVACDADCIVTRNARDFRSSPIEAFAPEELLKPRQVRAGRGRSTARTRGR